MVLCASPAYLKRRGVPKKPADLATHECVIHEGNATSNNWEFITEKTERTVSGPSRLAVNFRRGGSCGSGRRSWISPAYCRT